MDLTQIGLGIGLLLVSSLTFVGSSVLESRTVALLTGAALTIGSIAVFASVARDTQRS
ncbi:hypothetical protein [Natrarchaeobius chitinivorans]|uniref:hypothetical protein n=1 Tax=Natrarchaeobius chitinivorans TaxID=1679083 RepID=UPI0014046B6F|nr:hypothetical protein [Natrarchaeobius chitinivorans]